MNENQKKQDSQIFQVLCPCCQSLLWIDSVDPKVLKFERQKKDRGSLDDLLVKEKKRKDGFERKFEATAELEKERLKKAKEKYAKALDAVDDEDE